MIVVPSNTDQYQLPTSPIYPTSPDAPFYEENRLEARVHKQLWADSERRHGCLSPTDTTTTAIQTLANNRRNDDDDTTSISTTTPLISSDRNMGLLNVVGVVAVHPPPAMDSDEEVKSSYGVGGQRHHIITQRKKMMMKRWYRDADRARKMALVVTDWMEECSLNDGR
eukprot:TRINITY_DN26765_c0_g1_i4.p2 TRINITY_DN26765_c0_g1~~TRINITY_DN26765_c0_g1_i4.p2  ORF type:complete len:168 (+),score=22.42 TRINITY_DN26765_c0_g1_i4:325-828(+)